jgi:hypothetical protein
MGKIHQNSSVKRDLAGENDKRLILTLDHLEDNTAKKELHVHTKNYPHSLEQPFQPYKSNLDRYNSSHFNH